MVTLEEQVKLPSILDKKVSENQGNFTNLKNWELVQKNAFVGLMNSLLSKRKIRITDVSRDLRTGYILHQILEILSDISPKLPHKTCKSLFQCHDNMAFVFTFLRLGNKQITINEIDIVEGTDINVILGILWHIVLFYHLGKIQESDDNDDSTASHRTESSALKTLLKWINEKIKGKATVHDFTKSFKDGKAFCYLMEALDPNKTDACDLISDESDKSNKQNNISTLNNAFINAQEKYGIDQFLEPEQFYDEPNKEANVAYLSLFQAYEKYNTKKDDKIDKLLMRLNEAERKLKELTGQNNTLSESNILYQDQIRKLLKENETIKGSIGTESTKVETLEGREKGLVEEMNGLKNQNEILKKENRSVKDKNQRIFSENKQSREEVKQLESELVNKNEQLNDYLNKSRNRYKSNSEEMDFYDYLSELEIELQIPSLADFKNVQLNLLSEEDSIVKKLDDKWACSNCSFRNNNTEVLCRNCFFIRKEPTKAKTKKITPDDFAKQYITLSDPLSYQTTYIYYIGNNKHILKVEHDPNTEKKRIILDGNILKIKHKKSFWSSSAFNHEFYSSGLYCSIAIYSNKKKYSETKYSYELHIDGKSFEEYRTNYFNENKDTKLPVEANVHKKLPASETIDSKAK
eukprot:GAHX01000415.1.p1 GENE.GAHX01000415.1~~GAHX01000415.1.p1  ORF type:complete len:635 (-),score=150.28 GAHX01000415.1:29-1933(-)